MLSRDAIGGLGLKTDGSLTHLSREGVQQLGNGLHIALFSNLTLGTVAIINTSVYL